MNGLRMGAMVLAGVLVVGLSSAPAAAGVPTDQLKGAVERVLRTLDDPALRGDARLGDRRVAVRKIANEIFDFSEIAKRSMARHWQPLSEAQRTEFVGLFADLLERTYIAKIDLYGGERLRFTEERVDGDNAIVRARVTTKTGTEVPVEGRMHKKGDRWLIYDVAIENISLIANYRAQFDRIIRTSSYAELVKRLRTRGELLQDKERRAGGA